MSLEIRCTCGWRCQASEFYLGDRVACPECGAEVAVHANAGVPYGYAPYPTWQKKPAPVPHQPAHRAVTFPPVNPYAASAFWLGLLSLILAVSGAGAIVGVVLAPFAMAMAIRSRRWSRDFSQPADFKARAGLVLSCSALVLSLVLGVCLLASFERTSCHGKRTHSDQRQSAPQQPAQPRYQNSNARQREADARRARYLADEAAWREAARQQGYRYPAEPKPTPVTPRTEFEQKQVDYSENVRQQRAAEAGK